jgi:hypothetical protein
MGGCRRSGLPEVEGVDLTTESDDRKPAAAEVPGLGEYDRKCEGGGDCGIRGVTAGTEDSQTRLGGGRRGA